MGADFKTGEPIDEKFKKRIDSWDGMDWEQATYIDTDKKSFILETDEPDSECYERQCTHTPIDYCPKCGRKGNYEKN